MSAWVERRRESPLGSQFELVFNYTGTENLTKAEKKALEEQQVAEIVDEYNDTVDDDLDEVVCKKERVTGSRRSVRVCKTRRAIQEEQEASKRLMHARSRRGASPALPSGQALTDSRLCPTQFCADFARTVGSILAKLLEQFRRCYRID